MPRNTSRNIRGTRRTLFPPSSEHSILLLSRRLFSFLRRIAHGALLFLRMGKISFTHTYTRSQFSSYGFHTVYRIRFISIDELQRICFRKVSSEISIFFFFNTNGYRGNTFHEKIEKERKRQPTFVLFFTIANVLLRDSTTIEHVKCVND